MAKRRHSGGPLAAAILGAANVAKAASHVSRKVPRRHFSPTRVVPADHTPSRATPTQAANAAARSVSRTAGQARQATRRGRYARRGATAQGNVSKRPPGRSSKTIQTRFPQRQHHTGGEGPVGTPGGPKHLTDALSPAGRRFIKGLGIGLQSVTQEHPNAYSGAPGGTQKVGPFAFMSASMDPARSPAVRALELSAVPSHQIARGADKLLTGKDPGGRASFGQVLGDLGVKNKYVKAIAGTGLDVALDPTTYVGLGLERKAVEAGTKAAKGAAGATKSAARGVRVSMRAHVPLTNKGGEIGAVIPGTRALGRATRGVRRAIREGETGVRVPRPVKSARASVKARRPVVVKSATGNPVQGLGEAFVHDFRPSSMTPNDFQVVRGAIRRHKAAEHQAERRLANRNRAYSKTLKGEGPLVGGKVINAVERGPVDVQAHLALADEHAAARARLEAAQRTVETAGHSENVLHVRARATPTPANITKYLKAAVEHVAAQRGVKLAEGEVAKVTAAFDAGRAEIAKLPPKLQQVAAHVENDSAQQLHELVRRDMAAEAAGEGGNKLGMKFAPSGPQDAQGYVFHAATAHHPVEPPVPGQPQRRLSFGGRKNAQGGQRRAEDRRLPLSVLQHTHPGEYVTDNLPQLMSISGRESARNVHLHDLWHEVASVGRPVKPGAANHIDLPREGIYEVTKNGMKLVSETNGRLDQHAIEAIGSGAQQGRFVILDKRTVGYVEQRVKPPGAADTLPERFLDRVQGRWKFLATIPNPGFHLRNVLDDSLRAWIADATSRSFIDAYRGMKAFAHRERFSKSAEAVTEHGKLHAKAEEALNRTVKIKGRKTRVGDLIDEFYSEGAGGSGQIGREFQNLLHGQDAQGGKITRALEYREDFPRLASFIAARKRGMNASEAAQWSLKHHYDYGDLTEFERRVLRRAFPFYTFFARNTRMHLAKIALRPGKYATVAKVLNETAQLAGFNSYDDYIKNKPDYKQRGIPIPVKINGKVRNVFVSPSLTDLNQATLDPGQQAITLANHLTFYKAIPELIFNYSTFFQGPIQDPRNPLVPAPTWLADAPGVIRRTLGVKKYLDKRSGKMILGWPAKLDYAARQLPATNLAVQASIPGQGSRGMTPLTQIIAYGTGVKAPEDKPVEDELHKAQGDLIDLDNTISSFNQRGITKDKGATPEYLKLLDQRKQLQEKVFKLKRRTGFKILPGVGGPPKGSGGSYGAPSAGGVYGAPAGGGLYGTP